MKAVRLLLILLFVIPKHVIAEENSNQLLLTQYPATKKWGYTYNKSKTSRMFLPTRLTATSAFSAVGLGTSLIWGKKDRLRIIGRYRLSMIRRLKILMKDWQLSLWRGEWDL